MRKQAEDCGMDTVFYVFTPTQTVVERYLFDDWGSITDDKVKTWVEDLRAGVKKDDGSREDVCQFDADNLSWSADMVKNSTRSSSGAKSRGHYRIESQARSSSKRSWVT